MTQRAGRTLHGRWLAKLVCTAIQPLSPARAKQPRLTRASHPSHELRPWSCGCTDVEGDTRSFSLIHDLLIPVTAVVLTVSSLTAGSQSYRYGALRTHSTEPQQSPSNMHLILTGATGLVGAAVLDSMLAQESISRISILSRRPVKMAEGHDKAKVIIHKDFKTYDKALLDELRDAQGCVWALGVSMNDVNKEYARLFPSLEICVS